MAGRSPARARNALRMAKCLDELLLERDMAAWFKRPPSGALHNPDSADGPFTIVSLRAESLRRMRPGNQPVGGLDVRGVVAVASKWLSKEFGGRSEVERQASLLALVRGRPAGVAGEKVELDMMLATNVATGEIVGCASLVANDLDNGSGGDGDGGCGGRVGDGKDEAAGSWQFDGLWLSCLFLVPAVRGAKHRLGRLLVEYACAEASYRGARGLYLYTTESKLVKWYKSLCFTVEGGPANAFDAYVCMRRELRHGASREARGGEMRGAEHIGCGEYKTGEGGPDDGTPLGSCSGDQREGQQGDPRGAEATTEQRMRGRALLLVGGEKDRVPAGHVAAAIEAGQCAVGTVRQLHDRDGLFLFIGPLNLAAWKRVAWVRTVDGLLPPWERATVDEEAELPT